MIRFYLFAHAIIYQTEAFPLIGGAFNGITVKLRSCIEIHAKTLRLRGGTEETKD